MTNTLLNPKLQIPNNITLIFNFQFTIKSQFTIFNDSLSIYCLKIKLLKIY